MLFCDDVLISSFIHLFLWIITIVLINLFIVLIN